MLKVHQREKGRKWGMEGIAASSASPSSPASRMRFVLASSRTYVVTSGRVSLPAELQTCCRACKLNAAHAHTARVREAPKQQGSNN